MRKREGRGRWKRRGERIGKNEEGKSVREMQEEGEITYRGRFPSISGYSFQKRLEQV